MTDSWCFRVWSHDVMTFSITHKHEQNKTSWKPTWRFSEHIFKMIEYWAICLILVNECRIKNSLKQIRPQLKQRWLNTVEVYLVTNKAQLDSPNLWISCSKELNKIGDACFNSGDCKKSKGPKDKKTQTCKTCSSRIAPHKLPDTIACIINDFMCSFCPAARDCVLASF